MRLELILAFIISLLLLNRFVFKDVSPMLILQLTCVLIVIVIAVDYGTKCTYLERFEDDQESKKKLRFLESLIDEEKVDKPEAQAEEVDDDEAAEGFLSVTQAPTTTTRAPTTTTRASTTTTRAPTTTTRAPTTTTRAPTTTTRAPTTTTRAPAIITTGPPTKGPAGGSGEFGEDFSYLQFSPTMSLSFYFSVFNIRSYVPPNNLMNDIAFPSSIKQRNLTFARTPSIIDSDVRNGLFLGDNTVLGPLTSDMRINSGAYTLFFMCRFDNLAQDADMVALKMYGNTRDNNALTFRFSHVDKSPVIQTCKVSVRIGGDMEYYYCTIDNRDKIPFDKNISYLFAIVVFHSSIEIHMASTLSPTFQTSRILQKDIAGSITLSNKEIEVNPTRNWNVYLKAFGGYDMPLRPVDLDKISMHMFLQDKNLDKTFYDHKMRAQQLDLVIRDSKKCRLDAVSCSACKDVQWDQPQSLMIHANDNCLKAIDNYCMSNPGQQMCRCWNKGSAEYSAKRCTNLRNWVSGNVSHDIKKLDDSALKQIMSQYKLQKVPPPTSAPPKTTRPPTTTAKPTTTKPTTTKKPLPTFASKDKMPPNYTGVYGTNSLFDKTFNVDGDDALLQYMAHNLKQNRTMTTNTPSSENRQIRPHTHHDPLLDNDYNEPRGVFGWFKDLFSSGVPRDDYPIPE